MTLPSALEIRDLHVRYGQRVVLDGLNLTVPHGEWFTLLGPNGVGKSTLLHSIVGLLEPSSGHIYVCGYSIAQARIDALRRVGFACAPDKLPGLLTGRQCLQIYAAAKEIANADEVLGLAEELRFTAYLDAHVDTYSLGTRQKLCVLLALLGQPKLIVLDEAFNGLDPFSALTLKSYLRAQVEKGACSVLLATHALDIVSHYSDRAALLLNGHVARLLDRTALAMMSGALALENELALAAQSSPADPV